MTDPTTAEPEPIPNGPNGLTRITVNLRARTLADLDAMTARHALSKTDAIDRAVRLAALVDTLTDPSGALRVTGPDGTTERIHLL